MRALITAVAGGQRVAKSRRRVVVGTEPVQRTVKRVPCYCLPFWLSRFKDTAIQFADNDKSFRETAVHPQ